MPSFAVEWARAQFPAITNAEEEDPPFIFSDNAAGAQMPQQAVDAMTEFIRRHFVLEGGDYRRSVEMGEQIATVRSEATRYLGAPHPNTVFFGLNATTTLRLLSTSMAEILQPGDEIIVSGLEHEANVTPWLRLQGLGVELKYWKPRGPEARLQLGDLRALVSSNTRIVAVTGASNLLGTLPDLPGITEIAHDEGAIVVVDGVHYAPHRRIKVVADDIDFFVCSGYKICGPRVSIAYCSPELMSRLPSLNHFFLKEDHYKLELGAQNYEGIAALGGAFAYMRELAGKVGVTGEDVYTGLFDAILEHENGLTRAMLRDLADIDGITVFGIASEEDIGHRVPTFSIRLEGMSPAEMSRKLCATGIACRHGHNYAARLAEHLRVDATGGTVRISLCHYNTMDEVERILETIGRLK